MRATPEARRHLDRLPTKVLDAAPALIHGPMAESPRWVGEPLVGELAGLWSARRADYRVVDEIDDEDHVVIVQRVQHRGAVHRRR